MITITDIIIDRIENEEHCGEAFPGASVDELAEFLSDYFRENEPLDPRDWVRVDWQAVATHFVSLQASA